LFKSLHQNYSISYILVRSIYLCTMHSHWAAVELFCSLHTHVTGADYFFNMSK